MLQYTLIATWIVLVLFNGYMLCAFMKATDAKDISKQLSCAFWFIICASVANDIAKILATY